MKFERIPQRIEHLRVLDPIAEPVSSAVGSAGHGALKDFLSGPWLGHPLHPLLTDVPIGAWTSALALDLVGASARAADSLVALGLAGALPTAAAGLSGWSEFIGAERRLGLVPAEFARRYRRRAATATGIRCRRPSPRARSHPRPSRSSPLPVTSSPPVPGSCATTWHLTHVKPKLSEPIKAGESPDRGRGLGGAHAVPRGPSPAPPNPGRPAGDEGERHRISQTTLIAARGLRRSG